MRETSIRTRLINEWDMDDIDWMGYKLGENEMFSYHHLVPKRAGGKENINNGSILGDKSSHPYIHLIESVDFEMFRYITNMLYNINSQREMPSKQQLLAIRGVLEQFEREHCSDRSRKGNLIIKPEYVEGRIRLK